MKKLAARLAGLTLIAVAGGMLATAARAAGGGGGGGGGGFECPDIYDPVICSNGVVYPNACYASKAKANNCVPFGDD